MKIRADEEGLKAIEQLADSHLRFKGLNGFKLIHQLLDGTEEFKRCSVGPGKEPVDDTCDVAE